jgi:hypothetical protein
VGGANLSTGVALFEVYALGPDPLNGTNLSPKP